MRAFTFFLFLAISVTLAAALHYFIWARLVRDMGLSTGAHRAFTGLVIALFVSIPLTFWLGRQLPLEIMRPIMLIAYGWMGLMFLIIVILGAGEFVRLGLSLWQRLAGDGAPVDAERRLTLARILGASILGLSGGLGALAAYQGLTKLLVKEVRAPLARLPGPLHGFTIAQLTDVHIGPTIQREFIEVVVARTNALEPDLIAITGDLVDGSVEQLRKHVAPLAKLRAKHGVYFVTGNHEYYSGVGAWCREIERLGIRVLRNERVSIGDDEVSFDLAGIDDYNAKGFGDGHGPDLPRALEGRDPERELVLLAHQPRAAFEAEKLGVGLLLSGHTHGGQIWPWNFLVRLQQPFVSGLDHLGKMLVYVSNGTGYWGPPMRLGAPAEITRIVLESPSRA